MLILSRRIGEKLLIDNDIEVMVLGTERGQVKLGVKAPKEIKVMRQELIDKPARKDYRR